MSKVPAMSSAPRKLTWPSERGRTSGICEPVTTTVLERFCSISDSAEQV